MNNETEGHPDISTRAPATSLIGSPVSAKQPKVPSRSRWGCSTCRKRKVKCDEARPVCGHCHRLRLACVYDPLPVASPSSIRKPGHVLQSPSTGKPRSSLATKSTAAIRSSIVSTIDEPRDGFNTSQVLWPTSQFEATGGVLERPGEPGIDTRDLSHTINGAIDENFGLPPDSNLWDLDLLGEESLWANLPIFFDLPVSKEPTGNEDAYQQTSRPGGISLPELSWSAGAPQTQMTSGLPLAGENEMANNISLFESRNQSQTPGSTVSFSAIPEQEVILLRHFVDFAVPPILVGVEPRWSSARDTLFRVAKANALVRHAICSFSALSLAEDTRNLPSNANQSSMYYYDLALEELHSTMTTSNPETPNTKLNENILASIFFLSYVELMMSSKPKHTLDLLRKAHGISTTNTPSRSALGNQLKIWLKLLDAKVVSAGGDGFHLFNDTALKDFEGPPEDLTSSPLSPSDPSPESAAPLPPNAEDTLFNSLNTPAYNFHLLTLDFSGRIARLDKWHRPRGSVPDEIEVMQAAQKIISDLDALWSRRPAIIDLVYQHPAIQTHLSTSLSKKLQQNLRTYVANFHACYVHLQRVAYPTLPTTPETRTAVSKIVELVRLCEDDGIALSVAMLWPLMMAGVEVEDAGDREWVIGVIEGMKSRIGNAVRTARLVREICGRQRAGEGRRADARTVMQEVFGTVFAII